MRGTIHTHDPMLTLIYPPEKSVDYFGEDYLEDYGIELPDELSKEVIETYEKMLQAQEKLEKYLKTMETRCQK